MKSNQVKYSGETEYISGANPFKKDVIIGHEVHKLFIVTFLQKLGIPGRHKSSNQA